MLTAVIQGSRAALSPLTHAGPVDQQLLQFLPGRVFLFFSLLHPPGCSDGQTCSSGMREELPNHRTLKGYILVQMRQRSRGQRQRSPVKYTDAVHCNIGTGLALLLSRLKETVCHLFIVETIRQLLCLYYTNARPPCENFESTEES